MEVPGVAGETRRGTRKPVDAVADQARIDLATARCFKCPKERREDDPGWHFMDVQDRQGGPGRFRVYVCPRDYLGFAASERVRWMPIIAAANSGPSADASRLPLLPVRGPYELIAQLSARGLVGWALLVRDVAEGRVRRLHLRRLPADREIRQALVSYLQSAGAEITLAGGLQPGSFRGSSGSGGTSPR